jgi:hypothetical protein
MVPLPSGSAAALPECCKDDTEITRLDGKRVALIGTYRPVFLSKRRGDLPDHSPDGQPATTVAIETGERTSVMLEIYHLAQGNRDLKEIERFRGKRVRVVGTLHQRTPSHVDEDGAELQTMIGPYVGHIERIDEAGP